RRSSRITSEAATATSEVAATSEAPAKKFDLTEKEKMNL
ncbi:hypothetical protein L195_g063103, partial [Trifolium pratense]